MMPLARPASRFRAIRLPIVCVSPASSASPLKSGDKFWQQSRPVICFGSCFRINHTPFRFRSLATIMNSELDSITYIAKIVGRKLWAEALALRLKISTKAISHSAPRECWFQEIRLQSEVFGYRIRRLEKLTGSQLAEQSYHGRM